MTQPPEQPNPTNPTNPTPHTDPAILFPPKNLDLIKDTALTITWANDTTTTYPIAYLRKLSPSADMKNLREEMESNPLAVLPNNMANHAGPLTVTNAQLVGNYALKIEFSDGPTTGIYSWEYLRSIIPTD